MPLVHFRSTLGKGMRYVRNSIGVDTVVVNGQVAYCDNDYTKARSGTVCT